MFLLGLVSLCHGSWDSSKGAGIGSHEAGVTGVQIGRASRHRLLPLGRPAGRGWLTGGDVRLCSGEAWGAETASDATRFAFHDSVNEGSVCSSSDLSAWMRKGLFVQRLDVTSEVL